MKPIARGACSLLLVAGLFAQEPGKTGASTPQKPQAPVAAPPSPQQPQQPQQPQAGTPAVNPNITYHVDAMRKKLVAGKLVRSHVRLTVRLKNGNKLKGIVKDGRLIERDDGLRFVKANEQDSGAGIRLWCFDTTTTYVFLPFEEIADYRVQERLTSEQLRVIEDQVAAQQAAKKAQEEAAAAAAAAAAANGAGDPAAPAGETTPGDGAQGGDGSTVTPVPARPGLSEEQKKAFALLQEFPPTAGWNAARRDEISRRKAVIGANPSDHEKRFVEVFAEWQRACASFGITETGAKGGTATPEAKPGAGGKTEPGKKTTEEKREERRSRGKKGEEEGEGEGGEKSENGG